MMTMNRMTKKAALGGPSSDETFPLREKTKSYVLLLAAASYPAYIIYDLYYGLSTFIWYVLIPLLEPCSFISMTDPA